MMACENSNADTPEGLHRMTMVRVPNRSTVTKAVPVQHTQSRGLLLCPANDVFADRQGFLLVEDIPAIV
jgi:hypothetical protein